MASVRRLFYVPSTAGWALLRLLRGHGGQLDGMGHSQVGLCCYHMWGAIIFWISNYTPAVRRKLLGVGRREFTEQTRLLYLWVYFYFLALAQRQNFEILAVRKQFRALALENGHRRCFGLQHGLRLDKTFTLAWVCRSIWWLVRQLQILILNRGIDLSIVRGPWAHHVGHHIGTWGIARIFKVDISTCLYRVQNWSLRFETTSILILYYYVILQIELRCLMIVDRILVSFFLL